jgi:N-acetylmuramoyl-L-alanine amidase
MKPERLSFFISALVIFGMTFLFWLSGTTEIFKKQRAVSEPEQKTSEQAIDPISNPEEYYRNWIRPDGPLRVGLQAGHWKKDELPEELANLKLNGGTSWGSKEEWEVNLAIAEETKKILEKKGITVDLLPASIPPDYWADAFVSIHADGSENTGTAGFKVAAPRKDLTGKSSDLRNIIKEKYRAATKMQTDPNITHNMTGYYAFNWRRYEHSIHPMTPAAILETGFLTNYYDRQILVTNSKLPARGLADALLSFLGS